jgi:hypothetical protein
MNSFRKINRREYDGLFDQAPFRTFFHGTEFHEFLEGKFKWLKFDYYLYDDQYLFPIAKVGKKLVSLPFCEYGGPISLKENINPNEFNKDVLSEFKKIKIKFHPQIKIGNQNSDVSTHWIENLRNTSEQELWDSLRKTLRHEIKKAQDYGLVVRKCENIKELKHFYDLYVANLKRKKTVPYPWGVIQFLYKNPSSELLLAFYKDKIIGGDLFLHYSGFVHYFLSASNYKYRNFGTAHLILWEKMKGLIGQNIIFDLGATPKDSPLNIFKAGWGGKEYPILQIGIKRSAEGLRSSRLRNVWGLLPNFIIKVISPFLIKYRI